MQHSRDQRALEVLGDYLFELETQAKRRGASYGVNRTVVPTRPAPAAPAPMSTFDRNQEYIATIWEREKLREWKAQGRISEHGYLRVGRAPIEPYTLQDIMRVMPHLGVFDRLAALIDLDGVVEEGFMEAHENIREVVAVISRDEFEKVLATPEAQARIADIVHQQVGVIFGTLLEKIKTPMSTNRVGGLKQKCGKCGVPGHRAPTCTKTAEEIAAMQAEADAKKTDEAPE